MTSSPRSIVRRAAVAVLAFALAAPVFAYPTARSAASMIFDPGMRGAVVFGGVTQADSSRTRYALGDTWLWTGQRWVSLYPTEAPSPRSGAPMVFDENRSRGVLFGGFDQETYFNDTWLFEKGAWTKLATPSSPTARHLAAGVFDPVRDRMIVFGGTDATAALYDTWLFDGTTWVKEPQTGPEISRPVLGYDAANDAIYLLGLNQKGESEMYRWTNPGWEKMAPAKMPTCVGQAAMVFQEHSQRLALIGGVCNTGVPGKLHEWDGTNWVEIESKPGVGTLYLASAVYDPIRRETIVFGGVDGSERNETYRYRDGRWVEVGSFPTPGPRSLFVFASDPDSGVIWLYGGHNERTDFYDLWKYSAGRWQQIIAPNQPAACSYPVGAYDSDRKRLVIVCESSATYEWDGVQWHTFPNLKDKPVARRFSSMAYDPAARKTVLFGGYDLLDFRDETWVWNGTAWTQVAKKNEPDDRGLGSLFFDPAQKKVYLFGGIGRKSREHAIRRYNDMFVFDGASWTPVQLTTPPSPRYGAQTGIDPATGKVIMFGGKDENEIYINEQWEWSGSAWSKMTPQTPPSPRMNADLAIDPATGRLTLFGGYAGRYFTEIWTFDGTSWRLLTPESGRRRGVSRGAGASSSEPSFGSITAPAGPGAILIGPELRE